MPRIADLEKLLAMDPSDAFVLYGLAIEHAKNGSTDKAGQFFDRCIAADASYAYAYFHKARMLGDAGRVDEAKVVIEAGIAAAKKAGDEHAVFELKALLEEF